MPAYKYVYVLKMTVKVEVCHSLITFIILHNGDATVRLTMVFIHPKQNVPFTAYISRDVCVSNNSPGFKKNT